MSFLVSPAAVWTAFNELGDSESARQCAHEFESLLESWGNRLAAKVGINAGRATMDHDAFSGLLICMFPKSPGQPLPPCLEGADTDSEWEDEPTPQSIAPRNPA